MIVGKITELSCGCGERFRAFVKADDGFSADCPVCGTKCSTGNPAKKAHFSVPLDYTVQSDQGESVVDGYHPDEVGEARALLPGHDIQPDGTVRYRNAAHRRACYAEQASVFTRERERNGHH